MAKAKTAKKSTKVAAVAAVLPHAVVVDVEKVMKRDDISNCEAVRIIAKRYKSVKRGLLKSLLVEKFKLNPGTVNKQIQDGRSAAAK